MEWLLIALVYFAVFVGWLPLVVVPWLCENILSPLFWNSLMAIDYLLDNAVSPAIRQLGEALKSLWREIYYSGVDDGHEE